MAAPTASTKSNAVAAVLSQIIASAASLGLQVVALIALGQAGLGTFSILAAGVLVTINSLHTGFVGDALTVLDRFEPRIRRALMLSSAMSAVLATGAGFVSALVMAQRSVTSAAIFAGAVLAWTLEETCRRLLMARLEFWKLVVNDLIFGIVTAVVIGALWLANATFTIDWLVIAMGCGSIGSIILGLVQIPRHEFSFGPSASPDFGTVLSFSGWRAAQIGVRPVSLLIVRVMIARFLSAASLGLLETGRLLVAPAITVANGAGSFLLSLFAHDTAADSRRDVVPRRVKRLAGVGAAVVTAYGMVLLAALGMINHRLGDKAVTAALVTGWVVYAAAYAANIPIANLLAARRESKNLFFGRIADSVIAVVLATACVKVIGLESVPVAMAFGIVVGTAFAVRRSRLRVAVPDNQWGTHHFVDPTRVRGSLVPRVLGRRWVTILPLLLIVATEYKYRKRPLLSALSGSIDAAIIVELTIYAAVLGFLVMFIATPMRWRRPTAVQFFMRSYALFCAVSVVYSIYPKLGAVRAAQLLVMTALAMAIASRASRFQMHHLAHSYIAMIVASVFVGLVWAVPFSKLQVGRFNWMYVHSVIVAAMMAIALVLAVSYLLAQRGPSMLWPRWTYALSAAILSIALVATKTRGSMAGAVAGVAVVVALSIRRSDRLAALGVAAIVAILGALVLSDTLVDYVTRGQSTKSLTTLSNRTALWSLAVDRFKERPIFGWGFTASRGLFFKEVNLGGAHNAIVNTFVDGGLIGIVLWVALVVSTFLGVRTAFRRGQREAVMLFGVIATLMVNGVSTEGVGSGSGVSFLWLLIVASWVGVLQRSQARDLAVVPRRTRHLRQVSGQLT